jgi:hypothetical protein
MTVMIRPAWDTLVRLMACAYGIHQLTDDDVEYLLWERTCFPMGGPAHVIPQLHESIGGIAHGDDLSRDR